LTYQAVPDEVLVIFNF